MRREQADPYGPLRRELAELGYLSGEIRRAIDYYEREGTFRGCRWLDGLDQVLAEILLERERPMATVERTR